MTLAEVLGQDAVKTTLANAVKMGRVGHSYVLYGPRGCGKTTIARILAKTLNCHKPKDGAPCGKCASCVEIAESKSLDVIEIDAASNTGVDKVRSVIIEQVEFAPSRDKYKVYILDEVHMLSTGAFNALLKTVEEPPAHVVFIMATTEQNKVPPTILSRSQCFRFRPISEADIMGRVKEVAAKEKIKVDAEALRLIARSSEGAMRDAMTLLDRAASFSGGDVNAAVLSDLLGHPGPEVVRSLALALVNRDAAGLHSSFDKLNTEGHDPLAALRELRNLFAEAFLAAQGFSSEKEPIKGLPAGIAPAMLARLSRKLTVIIDEVKYSDSLAIAAEIALFTLIETPQELDTLVRRLEGLESRLAGGGASMPPLTEQKKNDRPAVAAPAPVYQARPAQPAPVPAARPAASPQVQPVQQAPARPGAADAWRKLLGRVSAIKPALYNSLLSVKIVYGDDGSWTLISATKFEAGMVERALTELEDILAHTAGEKIKLISSHGAASAAAKAPAPASEQDGLSSDEQPPEDENAELTDSPPPDAAPKGLSPKVSEPQPANADSAPELKHLSKVFHGRITRINKVK